MSFIEFLSLCRTLRTLYGRDTAVNFFTKNVDLYYNLDSASIFKSEKSS